MWILIIIVAIVAIVIIIKNYKLNYDTVIAFTGGLGSGKSLESCNISIKLLKKNRRKVRWHNFWHKEKKRIPLLYSSIPVRISKTEWATELTEEHLLLRDKLIEKSIVFIDEVDSFANQFQYKNPNVIVGFDEFVRLFRHYTKGGYLVVNTQCSENIVLEVRRRINTVFNLMQFKKFLCFYKIKVRNISLSEEIKTIETDNAEDNYSYKIGIIPHFKRYDTYCYSDRYAVVPFASERLYNQYKKNNLLKVSTALKPKKTAD